MEWHVGIKFWSGKKSDFEFFVAIFFFITFTVNIHKTNYAPVICIPGAGDTGGIAGLNCRDFTSAESRHAVDVPGFLIS